MKLSIQSPRKRQQGVATIAMLALLGLILIYLSINMRSISTLEREVKMVEQEQIKRLNVRSGVTNVVANEMQSRSIAQ